MSAGEENRGEIISPLLAKAQRARSGRGLRLLLLVAIAFVILAIVVYQADAAARARALDAADRAHAARAAFLADALDRVLQWRMMEVFTFAALPSVRGFAASDEESRPTRGAVARVELHAIVAADPHVRAASIVNTRGVVILTTDSSMLADWSTRLFVRAALAGHLFASAPARDFGEVSQYYSAPIINNAGDVAGALVLRVAVQELWGVLDAMSNVLLVDENGVRIADRTDKPQPFVALAPLSLGTVERVLVEKIYGAEVTQIPATNHARLADEIRRGRATALVYRDANGQTVRAALQPLATNAWTVVVFDSEDAILAPTRDALGETIRVAVVTLLVALGLAYAAIQFVFSPRENVP